jgi:hypothetical protein
MLSVAISPDSATPVAVLPHFQDGCAYKPAHNKLKLQIRKKIKVLIK